MNKLEKREDGLYLVEERKVDVEYVREKKEQLIAKKESLRKELERINEQLDSIELLKEEWRVDGRMSTNPESTESPSPLA